MPNISLVSPDGGFDSYLSGVGGAVKVMSPFNQISNMVAPKLSGSPITAFATAATKSATAVGTLAASTNQADALAKMITLTFDASSLVRRIFLFHQMSDPTVCAAMGLLAIVNGGGDSEDSQALADGYDNVHFIPPNVPAEFYVGGGVYVTRFSFVAVPSSIGAAVHTASRVYLRGIR